MLLVIVGLDGGGLFATEDVGGVVLGYAEDLLAGKGGVWVEEADDVGNVIVGEARVLLADTPRIQDILGRCSREGRNVSYSTDL